MVKKIWKCFYLFFKSLTCYCSEILKIYDFSLLLIECFLISSVIFLVDLFDLFKEVNITFLFIIFLFFLSIMVIFFKKENIKLIYAKNVNSIDKYIFIFLCVNLLYFIYIHFFNYEFYKTIIFAISFIICNLLFAFRWQKFSTILKNKKYNILDLDVIYNNKIELNKNETILLEEKAVYYDLLHRDNIINRLYNTIRTCYPEKSFTIGLNGKWGSGKTTLINNALSLLEKNEILDDFYIVRFDPWKYDDEKSILKGFLSEVLKDIPFEFNYENIDVLIDAVINVVFENKNINYLQLVTSEIGNIKKKYKIDKVVNNFLDSYNKRMLIIIDNLDRIDDKKAIFLIKCIETIVDFKNTIYILLYDEEILNKVCNKMFNTSENKYMEKIVQLKIDLPQKDKNVIEQIKNKVVNNILIDGKPIIGYLSKVELDFENIRELKRFINAILSSVDSFSDILNIEDYSKLLYIKNLNPNLYYLIWENKKYFVMYDRNLEYELGTQLSGKITKEAKEIFNDIFLDKNNLKFKEVLSSMFPCVKNYFNNMSDYYTFYTLENYNKSVMDNRISNNRYFDLYFTENENLYVFMNKKISNIVNIINSNDNFGSDLRKIFYEYSMNEIKLFLELLQLNISKINLKKYKALIMFLYDFHERVFSVPVFFEIGIRSRINLVISELIKKLDFSELNYLCESWENDYKNLRNFEEINYYLSKDNSINKDFIVKFDNFYKIMCDEIFEGVDIYSDIHYKRKNILSLCKFDEKRTREYLKFYIDQSNIYKFLSDFISETVGTNGYGYYIDSRFFYKIKGDIDIEKFLSEYNGKFTAKEKFINDVYNLYKNSFDEESEKIYLDTYLNLD